MLSLQALLCSPEPSDPQDAQVARMYLDNKAEFDRTAKYWTEMYATIDGEKKREDAAIDKVCEMGFDRESARKALEKHKWDEGAAVNDLLGMWVGGLWEEEDVVLEVLLHYLLVITQEEQKACRRGESP